MTTQEIISMAREAGCEIRNGHIYNQYTGSLDQMLKRFAKLVAEKEREECAKLADVWVRAYDHPSEAIARSIRERSKL